MTGTEQQTAAELGRAIEAGTLDPVTLAEDCLDRIAGHPAGPRIFARSTPDRALAEARAARDRARAGLRHGPLDGVPVSWKDLFDTAGVATEAGSALLAGRVPERDAESLRIATTRGTVCLGKTHMSELAFSGLGLNPVTATPPCVNDAGAVAGGSSSGAAASVAFGLAPAAVGSDTGGSVRVPAAWNDLVGLKTTSGRVSLSGVVPLAARFDTVGPLTRSVEDAALMLAALDGGRAPDLRGAPEPGRLRLARLTTLVEEDLREAPATAHDTALAALERAGVEIVPLEVPEIRTPLEDAGILYTTEAWATWGEAIEADPDAMYRPIRERFEAGRLPGGADYLRAVARMEAARAAWARATAGFDAVLCPTTPNLPPQVDRLMEEAEYYVTENLLTLRNTRVGNLMGGCAITLPTGTPSCGLSLMAPPMQEHRLLRVAAAVERVLR
ncbi:amidase [Pseudoponticoccus marisrubri]|uniref:Amidase n=1 Tax=Pseudoponticoccus marisrubri TaxID=1685382 RepID=A0A0W7WKC7_9RHOB|nr:amidase family protein [Pseudoponticoccus marisrubri]KUF11058.1 amidase [Pseudoponticoccus marisrubri]